MNQGNQSDERDAENVFEDPQHELTEREDNSQAASAQGHSTREGQTGGEHHPTTTNVSSAPGEARHTAFRTRPTTTNGSVQVSMDAIRSACLAIRDAVTRAGGYTGEGVERLRRSLRRNHFCCFMTLSALSMIVAVTTGGLAIKKDLDSWCDAPSEDSRATSQSRLFRSDEGKPWIRKMLEPDVAATTEGPDRKGWTHDPHIWVDMTSSSGAGTDRGSPLRELDGEDIDELDSKELIASVQSALSHAVDPQALARELLDGMKATLGEEGTLALVDSRFGTIVQVTGFLDENVEKKKGTHDQTQEVA